MRLVVSNQERGIDYIFWIIVERVLLTAISVLEGFRVRRLAVIQEELDAIVASR